MKCLSLILALIAQLAVANTDVYQYTNAQGNLVVSNQPSASAKKMNLPPLNVAVAPMSNSDFKANGYTAQNYSRIGLNSYIGPNETRRTQILQEELSKEKTGLNNAQQLLNQSKAIKFNSESEYQARIKALQDAINEHQKNIEILNKQLENNPRE